MYGECYCSARGLFTIAKTKPVVKTDEIPLTVMKFKSLGYVKLTMIDRVDSLS